MSKNNICSSIIVYGSWAPGEKNHHMVSHLPGSWEKGKILVDEKSEGDNIHPGGNKEIDAWILSFSDCNAEMFTPEWDEEEKMLFKRWTDLDSKMGSHLERDQKSWWPVGAEPVAGKNGQLVVNIYLPVQNFTHLQNVMDTPDPEDEDDIHKLWMQQKSGKKKYEDYVFIALIKDSTYEQCKELFSGLPGIEPFIEKLSAFYKDQAFETGYLLEQTEDGFYLYARPKPENKISFEEAEQLVKKEFEQKIKVLQTNDYTDEAEALGSLDFKQGNPPGEEGEYCDAEGALEEADDLVRNSTYSLNDHWKYCLSEACYGIAATYVITHYLMSSFYKTDYDFETAYRLWKGGWEYKIYENVCYIFEA